MSYYGFDPNDWRAKLPKGVQFYDYGGGVYQVPAVDPSGSYLTASMLALCEDLDSKKHFKILMFQIPHGAYIKKNSDWGPIVDRMVDYWKSGKFEPTDFGSVAPTVYL